MRLGAAARVIAPERRPVDEILPGRDVVMDVKARDDVVEHRQLLEQPDLLEGARDAEPHAPVRRQSAEVGAAEIRARRRRADRRR